MKREWTRRHALLLTGRLVMTLLSARAARGQNDGPHYEPIDLAGSWRFALDREDVGAQEQWFDKDLPDRITLPGVLQAQGFGDEISTTTPWVLALYDRWWEGQADNAIDGDPNTFWQAGEQKQSADRPQALTISFPAPVALSGLVLMPRQNHREHEGDIREYMIQVSDDGREWREAARGELVSTFAPQQIHFPQTLTVRQLKLTALDGFGPDKTAALAELAIIYAGPKLPDTGADVICASVGTAAVKLHALQISKRLVRFKTFLGVLRTPSSKSTLLPVLK